MERDVKQLLKFFVALNDVLRDRCHVSRMTTTASRGRPTSILQVPGMLFYLLSRLEFHGHYWLQCKMRYLSDRGGV